MATFLSLVATIGSFIGSAFSLIATAAKVPMDFFYHVIPRTIQVEGETDDRPIIKGKALHVPAATKKITVRGKYWIHPSAKNYALFLRKKEEFWPQNRADFAGDGTWESVVYFGSLGSHRIILAKLSPELEVLFDYYRKVVDLLDAEKKELKKALPDDKKKLEEVIRNYKAITVRHHMPGLKILREFEVILG